MCTTLLKCQLKGDGTCSSCSVTAPDDTIIKCVKCKMLFHAVCSSFENEICNKSLYKVFTQKSTKRNFMWFCDSCLTSFELDAASNDTTRINNLEKEMGNMTSKLEEMKELIMLTIPKDKNDTNGNNTKQPIQDIDQSSRTGKNTNTVNQSQGTANNNPWHVPSKITILKDTLGHIPDLAEFEKNVLEKNLNIKKVTHDKKGNIVLQCPTAHDAVAVHEQATKDLPRHTILEPRSPSCIINVVGFYTEHDVDTIHELLIKGNVAFSALKDKPLEDVKKLFNILTVKPCAKNNSMYQAVIRVSKSLRHQIKLTNNRLKVGFYSCPVYDRILAKRCNRCQDYGHWADQCPKENPIVCAKCSGNHDTSSCVSTTLKCVHCAKISGTESCHSAASPSCPSYFKYRDTVKENSTFL